MRVGRPTLFKEEYCDQVIEVMKEGASKTEFCVVIGISKQTFYQWVKKHPMFDDAVKVAELHSQAWWEKKGREATFKSEGFNATSYIFQMKNRFKDDWRDKQHIESESKVTVTTKTDDELEARLKVLREGLSDE